MGVGFRRGVLEIWIRCCIGLHGKRSDNIVSRPVSEERRQDGSVGDVASGCMAALDGAGVASRAGCGFVL